MASAKQNYKSGQAHGQGQAKTEEWVQSTKDTANAAKDRTANATQSTKDKTTSAAQSAQESAQYGKDQSAGFLQQTGEQVKNMAQNTVDSVKNTIGMAERTSNIAVEVRFLLRKPLSVVIKTFCFSLF
nr:late embryogenesis abundant protein 1 [Quercus suber]